MGFVPGVLFEWAPRAGPRRATGHGPTEEVLSRRQREPVRFRHLYRPWSAKFQHLIRKAKFSLKPPVFKALRPSHQQFCAFKDRTICTTIGAYGTLSDRLYSMVKSAARSLQTLIART